MSEVFNPQSAASIASYYEAFPKDFNRFATYDALAALPDGGVALAAYEAWVAARSASAAAGTL